VRRTPPLLVMLSLLGAGGCRQPGTITVLLERTSSCGNASRLKLVTLVGSDCSLFNQGSKAGCSDVEQLCSGAVCTTPCSTEGGADAGSTIQPGFSGCPLGRFDGDVPLELPAEARPTMTLVVAFSLVSATGEILGGGCSGLSVDRSTDDVVLRIEATCCRP